LGLFSLKQPKKTENGQKLPKIAHTSQKKKKEIFFFKNKPQVHLLWQKRPPTIQASFSR
jgi:hypothetical protein